KAIWCHCGGESCSYGRVAGHELLEFRRFSGVGRARGQGQQQIAKIFAGCYWKELERIDHHVGVAAVREMKLDGHAVRIGGAGPVRHIRYSSRIGESHGRWDRAAVKQYRSTQPRCFRRRLEAAFDNDAFGVIGAEARMDSKYLVHRPGTSHSYS